MSSEVIPVRLTSFAQGDCSGVVNLYRDPSTSEPNGSFAQDDHVEE